MPIAGIGTDRDISYLIPVFHPYSQYGNTAYGLWAMAYGHHEVVECATNYCELSGAGWSKDKAVVKLEFPRLG